MDQFSAVGVAAAASFGLSRQAIYMLWCGIGIYLLAMLAIGVWSSRRIKKMSDFLVAGRRLPLWMATATMLVSTVVWIGYTFIFSAGSGMEFVELMNSPEFERNLTCGAVYGFASGVLTFLFCLAGEKLTAAMVSGEENGE